MSSTLRWLLAAVLLVAALPAVAATVVARDARIVEVTLFTDRAEVVREARLDLPAGASSVEFAGVPFAVERDSFRVNAKGVAATLGAVEIKARAGDPEESPALVAARQEVRRIEGELALLAERAKNAAELRNFLISIRASTAAKEGQGLAEGKADPAAIQAVFNLLRTSLDVLAREEVERQRQREDLERELQIARAKLGAARPAGELRSHSVTVEVQARQAGALTMQLSYVVRGAAWRPSYRASLDAATGEVGWISEAAVRQSTGEDWIDVELKLSTAAPARGVTPPELTPWLLLPAPIEFDGDGAKQSRVNPNSIEEMERITAGAMAEAPPAMDAVYEEAGVVRSAYNVAFEVPGKTDVPADGSEHRVVLRQETLSAKVSYRVVPALDPSAYLVATTTAPAGYPLLAGPVRVFAGSAFLGTFQLAETGPGAELRLPFGIDNRVKVERVPLPQERSREGLSGKTVQISQAFRTTVENLRDQVVEIDVVERVPVSQDERIEVEIDKETTPGHHEDPDRPGVLIWTLKLGPKDKREIVLAYTVRHPRDLPVPGF